MAKKKKISFNEYHQELFKDRWPLLEQAMQSENLHFELNRNFKQSYFLDEASVWVGDALPINEGDIVLDMCAAPGGKSLVLASKLKGKGELVCNDRSDSRRARLAKVLKDHLPDSWSSIARIYGHDATKWGMYEENKYDKILLDAPCSSERHVLNSPHHLEEWSPARPKNLAIQQYALLCAALTALKPGGLMIYSTCSINPIENEKIIEKLLKKLSKVSLQFFVCACFLIISNLSEVVESFTSKFLLSTLFLQLKNTTKLSIKIIFVFFILFKF